ncbi:MAG: ferrochelatase [Actinobacteria bacterium]|nr:MAG: ferrochelatase [Actinomycetota bacterium]
MSIDTRPVGVLLLQLGTPDSTEVSDVRRYLREFLSDPRVLDIPAPARALLLNAVILPFRPRRSAEQYEKIWTENGSPLTIHTETLTNRLQESLGDGYRAAYGMRYQNPSVESAVAQLIAANCDQIVVLPLFPQYSSAATGSALEEALRVIGGRWNVVNVTTISDFFDDMGFVESVADVARPHLDSFQPDHVLFSYHGLPERQVKKSDPTGEWCLARAGCCDQMVEANRFCYRAQCFATTRSVAAELGLDSGSYSTTFQSRLAGQKWIEPYTDVEVGELYKRGVRRLAVLTPSFTADCLETLEEIGIRLREQWRDTGGEDLLLVPCVNAEPKWVSAVAEMVRGVT